MVDRALWHQLSLSEQMGYIGAEFKLAKDAEEDEDLLTRDESLVAGLSLLELTMNDPRFSRHREGLDYLYAAVVSWQAGAPTWSAQKIVAFCSSFLLDETSGG